MRHLVRLLLFWTGFWVIAGTAIWLTGISGAGVVSPLVTAAALPVIFFTWLLPLPFVAIAALLVFLRRLSRPT